MSKLKLFNTLTRKIEPFKSIKSGEVKIYTCGPTVYNFPHIGNYRAYIVADLLKRTLIYNGYKVTQAMNITDVDDKTIRDSQKEGTSLRKFTEKYTKAFLEETKSLNILPPNILPKATNHVKEMTELIEKLIKKKIAYQGEDGSIYYSVKKFKDYGKLAGIKTDNLKAGARVKQDEYTKDSVSDFALWKSWDESDGEVFWETKIGKGRPGWHIECSAMATKYLGKHFDIHTGGIDLVFPHHQNEIAQTEAVTNKKFVNYWVHNEWLLVNGKKMSKSLKNFYTLNDLAKQTYKPIHYRYLSLLTHYRKPMNFTFDNIDAAKTTYERIKRKIIELKEQEHKGKDKTKKYEKQFQDAINDDLNIPEAVQVFIKTLDDFDFSPDKKLKLLENFDEVLGLDIKDMQETLVIAPKEVETMIAARENFRENKMWKEADILRERIKEAGYEIEDSSKGPVLRKI